MRVTTTPLCGVIVGIALVVPDVVLTNNYIVHSGRFSSAT